jgi:hypothetical protein
MFRFILLILFLPASLYAQNPTACDSVNIDCCSFEISDNTLSLKADNQSSYLFPYPGFVILDVNDDTIAKETVNYFGIGTFPQVHTLEIYTSPELPFTGTLELHSLFYDTLHCVFDITLPDTAVAIGQSRRIEHFRVFPNPCADQVWIEWDGDMGSMVNITIQNINQKTLFAQQMELLVKPHIGLDVSDLPGGIYFIKMEGSKKVETFKMIKQ